MNDNLVLDTPLPEGTSCDSLQAVSVVIPAWNCGREIEQAVQCALGQASVSVEVIIVDDGSTDDTADVLRDLQSRHPTRVTVMTQANGGPAAARNTGIQSATCDWVAFLDHDDVWAADKLALQLEEAQKTNADVVVTAAQNFDDLERVAELRSVPDLSDQGSVYVQLLNDNFVTLSSVLVRRAMLLTSCGFVEQWKGVEDWALWLNLADSGCQFASVQRPLVRYRWHGQSLSRRHEWMQQQRKELVRQSLRTQRARGLSTSERCRIRSEERICSAWFMSEKSLARAAWIYAQSIAAWPFGSRAWKGLAKCLLGRS